MIRERRRGLRADRDLCRFALAFQRKVEINLGAGIDSKNSAGQAGEDVALPEPVINGLKLITTSIIKSLLTSLCQREELPLFDKEG
jgi:hypothetical protein